MWRGWFTAGGTEIVNNTRTAQYAANMGIGWLTPKGLVDELPLMLGDGDRYTTPLQDDAPWVDPDNPWSWEFLGFYCLGVKGFEDSSRTVEVIEYITDGGTPGRTRHGTLSGVFNGILVATSEEGLAYGMGWMRQATLDGPCSDSVSPFGVDLCYLEAAPRLVDVPEGLEVPDPVNCLPPYRRTLRRFKVVQGPQEIAPRAVSRGAALEVQFTAVAGGPWRFGDPVDIVTGFLGPDPVGGVASDIDPFGYIAPNVDCSQPLWSPLYDPYCPALIAPPGPPDVALGCFSLPSSWLRRSFTIPEDHIPLWAEALPVLSVSTGEHDLRMMRFRFYANPDLPGGASNDPCSFCGDIVITYIPPNSTLVFDAVRETVEVQQRGGLIRRADTLVVGSDGKPFTWPSLSCGFEYVVTFDQPLQSATPVIDMALVPRYR